MIGISSSIFYTSVSSTLHSIINRIQSYITSINCNSSIRRILCIIIRRTITVSKSTIGSCSSRYSSSR
nr:MAG TPA: hypothetical protein [Caudoviricetes sp.]